MMNPLVHFLRFFTISFGLTQSRPEEEGKHALMLALILGGIGIFVMGMITLIVMFFH
jgi:hypothetical protein